MANFGKCYVRKCEDWVKTDIYLFVGPEIIVCDFHTDEANEIGRKANDIMKKISREALDEVRQLKLKQEET